MYVQQVYVQGSAQCKWSVQEYTGDGQSSRRSCSTGHALSPAHNSSRAMLLCLHLAVFLRRIWTFFFLPIHVFKVFLGGCSVWVVYPMSWSSWMAVGTGQLGWSPVRLGLSPRRGCGERPSLDVVEDFLRFGSVSAVR